MKTPSKARSDPSAVVEAIFYPGVWAETCSMVILSASTFGLPGFVTALDHMAPLDERFSSRLHVWRQVTEAYALELYLKALACVDHGTHLSASHNLQVLFDDLKDATREAIRTEVEAYDRRHPSPPIAALAAKRKCSQFDAALDASADAFVLLRYLHQPDKRDPTNWNKDFLARHIMQSTRRVAVSMKPEWRPQTAHLLSR